jgi:protein-disulfide isomerase
VARGQAHVEPTPTQPPLVLAAGDNVRLPAEAPTPPVESPPNVAKKAPQPGPSFWTIPVPEDCKDCDQAPPDVPFNGPRAALDLTGTYALGPATARVTIVEFGDFECHFCTKAMSDLHELRQQYPDDVRIVFMNYPLPNHKNAQLAAEASLAAGEQGKFWEMHDLLLANPEGLSRENLDGYARTIGLDVKRFAQDLDTHVFAARVSKDKAMAEELGIEGTPTFFINGRRIMGARPMEFWKQMVEQELGR